MGRLKLAVFTATLIASAGCGRLFFNEVESGSDAAPADATPIDACEPTCTNARCGDADGCGGTCADGAGCCVDECTLRAVRCTDGVDEQCANTDADPCTEWSWPTACPSGTCQSANACAYSNDCVADPITYVEGPAAPTGLTCDVATAGQFTNSTHLAGGAGPGIEIDGVLVSSCVKVDYGNVCTPSQACQTAQAVASACGDDCGGACTECTEPFNGSAIVYVFGSPVDELERYRAIGVRVMVTPEPGTHGGCIGFSAVNVRYMLLCRVDCGPDAYNVNVGNVTLANPT